MLGLVEETILLLLRHERGSFRRVPTSSQRLAIAGAVLMELADANRIDTDGPDLILLDSTPTGDRLLDPTLAEIAAGERQSTRYWIEYVAERADVVRAGGLGRLIGKGILTERHRRFLWVFRTRRYPAVDGHVPREVRVRLIEVLLGDKFPDPRDVMLIFLADACGILRALLPRRKLAKLGPRIERLARLDAIGQTMMRAIVDVRRAVVTCTGLA